MSTSNTVSSSGITNNSRVPVNGRCVTHNQKPPTNGIINASSSTSHHQKHHPSNHHSHSQYSHPTHESSHCRSHCHHKSHVTPVSTVVASNGSTGVGTAPVSASSSTHANGGASSSPSSSSSFPTSSSVIHQHQQQQKQQQLDVIRKRQYRVGLNLFNRGPPERGIQLLIQTGFIELSGSKLLSNSFNGPSSSSSSSGQQQTSFSAGQKTLSSTSESNKNPQSSSSIISSCDDRLSSSPSMPNLGASFSLCPTNHQDLLASSVAHFMITRKGLSKQRIGEYLGNLQNSFNQRVLDYFIQEIDLRNLMIDDALRKYQTTFRFPGETQQIERLVEKFSFRYLECNPDLPRVRKEVPDPNVTRATLLSRSHPDSTDNLERLVSSDGHVALPSSSCNSSITSSVSSVNPMMTFSHESTVTSQSSSSSSGSDVSSSSVSSSTSGTPLNRDEVFILSFAIIMLNTDLHVPSNKSRMTCAQWIKNLKGVFPGGDLSDSFLTDIYERIKSREFKTGVDHVSQVLMLQQQLLPGNTKTTSELPNLAVPERRLVCFCRLFEVPDVNRKDRPGQHQREIFLCNDLLLVTKIVYKNPKKSSSAHGLNNETNSHDKRQSHKSSVMSMPSQSYSFRGSYPLLGLTVKVFASEYYPFGIKIIRKLDSEVILTFNARSSHDRNRFVMDLKESIEEMHLTEASINFLKNNMWKTIPVLTSSNKSQTCTQGIPHSASSVSITS